MNRPVLILAHVEQDLVYWQATHARMQANLFALYEHPTFQRIKGDSTHPMPQLRGESAKHLPEAVARVGQMLQMTVGLSRVVSRAKELLAQMPLIFKADQLEKIDGLLHGASVEIGDAAQPLESRGLLSKAAGERRLTPRQVLELMTPDYESARDLILRVDAVWNRLPGVLDAFEKRVAEFERGGLEIGEEVSGEAEACRLMIVQARECMESDPLAIALDLETSIEGTIKGIQERIQDGVRRRAAIQAEVAGLIHQVQRLEEAEAKASASREECIIKTDVTVAPLAVRAGDLSQQSAQLKQAIEAGNWHGAEAETRRLGAEIQEACRAAEATLLASRSTLDLRLELRGRLEVLKVKAQASGLSEEPLLGELARAAHRLLFGRPTPMKQAQELVVSYQRKLDAIIQGRARS